MNQCFFSGRLTRDAETVATKTGDIIAKFGLAVNCGYGEYVRTEFLNCFKFKAEKLAPHLTKGKPVTIRAEMQTNKWKDQQTGEEKSRIEFLVNELEFQMGIPAGQNQPHPQTQTAQPQGSAPNQTADPFAELPF